MPERKPKAGRRAVVEHVHGKAIETDLLSEALDNVGDVLERVGKSIAARHVRLAESRQIGSDDMEAVGKHGNQVAKHVARTRKALEKQHFRRPRTTRFPLEHPNPL